MRDEGKGVVLQKSNPLHIALEAFIYISRRRVNPPAVQHSHRPDDLGRGGISVMENHLKG